MGFHKINNIETFSKKKKQLIVKFAEGLLWEIARGTPEELLRAIAGGILQFLGKNPNKSKRFGELKKSKYF